MAPPSSISFLPDELSVQCPCCRSCAGRRVALAELPVSLWAASRTTPSFTPILLPCIELLATVPC
jgi:hypothetical protein